MSRYIVRCATAETSTRTQMAAREAMYAMHARTGLPVVLVDSKTGETLSSHAAPDAALTQRVAARGVARRAHAQAVDAFYVASESADSTERESAFAAVVAARAALSAACRGY